MFATLRRPSPGLNARALLVAAALLVVCLGIEALEAQTPPATKIHRIGVLWPGAAPPPGARMDWFRQGLHEFGYVEGQNIAIDLRYGETADRLRALASELVRSKVSVLATFGDLAPTVAQQATSAIPIVALADDFVGAKLVPNLARPGGNLTGVTILSPELSAKRLAVLKELMPKLSRVAALWDPANPSQKIATEEAARALSIKLLMLEVRKGDDLPDVFRAAKSGRAEALNVFASRLCVTAPVFAAAVHHGPRGTPPSSRDLPMERARSGAGAGVVRAQPRRDVAPDGDRSCQDPERRSAGYCTHRAAHPL